jgi:hypothetical protein
VLGVGVAANAPHNYTLVCRSPHWIGRSPHVVKRNISSTTIGIIMAKSIRVDIQTWFLTAFVTGQKLINSMKTNFKTVQKTVISA